MTLAPNENNYFKNIINRPVWKAAARRWQIYLLLLIPIIYKLIFSYYPMFGAQIAFKNFNAASGIWGSPWVGFLHFKTFFKSFYFKRVITNTLRISLYSLASGFPLTIIFALILNAIRNLKFKKIVQTITYIPHFISTVVLVGMLFQVLNPVSGIHGNIYRLIHEGKLPPNIFANPNAFIHLYIWSGIWQGIGWSSIIYIATLTGVPIELHEAAEIDGATRFKRIIHIDFPAIIPTASILLILRTGNIMSVGFEKIYLMQNDLNLVYSEVISTYVYKVGMSGGGSNFSYASAIGLFNSIINLILLITVNKISKKLSSEGSSLW